jgi:hypothetical protein
MNQQIGYPDYIVSDNTTRIEDDYADVKNTMENPSESFFCYNYLV